MALWRPIPDKRVEAALSEITRDAMRPVATGLAGYYAFLAVLYYFLLPTGVATLQGVSALLTGLTFGGLRLVISKGEASRVHVMTAAAAGLVLANSLLVLAIEQHPRETTSLTLLVIGCGGVMVSAQWFSVTLVATLIGWLAVALPLLPDREWAHFGFGLAAGSVLAGLLFVARRSYLVRFEELRRQDESRRLDLLGALEREEATNQELAAAIDTSRRNEARFRNLSEATFEGIALHDEGRITEANANLRQIFGYDAAQIVGMKLSSLFADEAIASGDAPLERLGRRANGERFPVEVRGKRIAVGDEGHLSVTVMRDLSEIKAAEAAAHRADVAESRNVELEEEIAHRQQVEAELRELTDRLEKSNQALQDFAYVASHDLREPLRKVQAFGERLSVKYAEELGDRGLDYIVRMRSAADRMQQLIDGLLQFSRVTTKAQPFKPTALGAIVEGVLSDLEVAIEQSKATFEVGELPTIDADGLQMRQLFQNLISNALKYQESDHPPAIRIDSETLPADGKRPQRCQITVSDDGIGFAAEHAERIFGVFQRLHGRERFEGSGIGLAICRKLVERHGGEIHAEGTPGEGARFVISLPVEHDEAETPAPASKTAGSGAAAEAG